MNDQKSALKTGLGLGCSAKIIEQRSPLPLNFSQPCSFMPFSSRATTNWLLGLYHLPSHLHILSLISICPNKAYSYCRSQFTMQAGQLIMLLIRLKFNSIGISAREPLGCQCLLYTLVYLPRFSRLCWGLPYISILALFWFESFAYENCWKRRWLVVMA